jgi:hypothetical protein
VMLGELVVSLYIFGVLAVGVWLLKLVLDGIVERFIAHPFRLSREIGCELAKWAVVIPVISLAFVGVSRLFLFLSLV